MRRGPRTVRCEAPDVAAAARCIRLLAAVWLATLGAASHVRAQAVDLHYQAAAGDCPDAAWFRAEVMARLQRDPFRAQALTRVDVVISRTSAGGRGVIRVSQGGQPLGVQELVDNASDCRELASALALSVVLVLEDVAPEPAPARPTEPPLQPTSEPPPVSPRDIDTAEGAATDVRLPSARVARRSDVDVRGVQPEFGIDVGGGLGQQPGLAGLGSVGLGAGGRRWALRLDLRGAWPETVGDEGAKARVSLFGLALHACVRRGLWGVCAFGQVDALRASGRALPQPRSATAWAASMGPELVFRYPLGRGLSLRGRVEAAVPLRRPKVVAGDRVIWRAPWLRAALWLGLQLRLGTQSRTESQR